MCRLRDGNGRERKKRKKRNGERERERKADEKKKSTATPELLRTQHKPGPANHRPQIYYVIYLWRCVT